jgi:hypothetical protein
MMSARSTLLAVTLAVSVTAGAFIVTSVPTVAAAAPTWTAAFRDDFSGSGLPNPADWQLTLGTSYPGGPASFGTGEIETLTNNPANVNVRNGRLVITPQRDSAGAWTSARVETRRANFKPPAGGVMHVESRVQMPNVTGAQAMGYWPAFWMLGSPYRADRWSWPGIGEFDIMENVQGLNWSYNVLHCGIAGTWGGPCNEPEGINNGGAACHPTTCQAAFHTYAIEWDRTGAADQLRWYIDGALTFTVNQNQVPAQIWSSLSDHAGYFIILNVAIGGAFPNKLGGGPTAATKPGVPMLVDYVEVKYAGGQATPPPTPTFTTTTTTTTPTNPTPTNPTVPPTGVPSNLRVAATADSTITLGWNGTAGATYDVLRSGVRIATVTGTTFTDQGLFENTPYVYSIRGGGVTTPELTATIGSTPTTTTATTTTTTTTAPSPGTPSNLRVTATTSSTITLGWDGPANASYQVLRSGIQIATVTGRAFTDQGLFKNTPYIYSIRGNGVTTPQITATIS